MQSFWNTVRGSMILQAIMLIILGAILLCIDSITMYTLVYLVGILLTISGAVALIGYFRARSKLEDPEENPSYSTLAYGIALLVIPIVMFVIPDLVAGLMSWIVGVLLILSGALNAKRSFMVRRAGGNAWLISLCISILIIAGGVLLIINPFQNDLIFTSVLGGIMLVNGISDLLLEFWGSKARKNKA